MSPNAARTIGPIAAFVATMGARKVMNVLYEKRTGHEPPLADDREVPIAKALGWALLTAVVSVSIEVAFTRLTANKAAELELEAASEM